MKLQVWLAADQELEEAAVWYEEQREGLGTEFLDEYERRMKELLADPTRFPLLETLPIDRSIRRCRLARFPYAIVFEMLPNEVVVFAVSHLHRDPDRLVRRIRRGP
ncbi:MAG: type II toxin-antitoxin system RelE/ParE family toxin [Planctomycetota bacterium]|nr:type II toxin-antitoxin system RelE/ParE family toxin [Planctomycetota bacterium]